MALNGNRTFEGPESVTSSIGQFVFGTGKWVYDDRKKKLTAFREGAIVAKKTIDLLENSTDAHFLFTAKIGNAAELQGLVMAATTVQKLKKHAHLALEFDEQHVPAHHMLGRIYYKELPWFLGEIRGQEGSL